MTFGSAPAALMVVDEFESIRVATNALKRPSRIDPRYMLKEGKQGGFTGLGVP